METIQNQTIHANGYRDLPISQLQESPTNPRRRYNAAGLEELAASIKAQGILAPLLVREIEPERFEVIAGSRRFRAAQLAGVEEVPVRVIPMTDAEAIFAQVVENLQREDIHPLEEANGFRALLELSGQHYNIATIAAKAGKSESYVTQRLRLAELIPSIAEAFLEDRLTVGHALLIAKLPAMQQPESFTAAFRSVWMTNGQAQVLLPVKELAGWIETNILLELQAAPFDKGDATLVPEAGSCHECSKRTGFNALLFTEVRNDSCSDPQCFKSKVEAHLARTLERRPELIQLSSSWSNRNGGPLGRNRYTEIQEVGEGKRKIKNRAPLTPAQKKCPHVSSGIVMDGGSRGQIVTVCAEPTCQVHHAESRQSRASQEKIRAEQRKQDEKRKQEMTARHRVLSAILQKVSAPLKKADLEMIALEMLGHLPQEYRISLVQRHKLEVKESQFSTKDFQGAFEAKVKTLDEAGLSRFLIETALLESAYSVYGSRASDRLQAAAKRYRINTERIAEDVAGEFAAKRKKQEQKRKADGIGAAKKKRAKDIAGASA